MSTNYLVNVPKLKGRENYDDWCFAAENVLVLEGMADNIKRPLPATATEAQIAEDLKAKAKLILTIDASLYVHIKQATTTYSLWQILKNMFDDSGYARKISLLRNLISIRLENCESMTSYVSQIIETAHKLNGTGFEINDQWIGSLMLAGLPEKFSPMIMAIEHSGINISADAIKTKLLDMSADFEDWHLDSGASTHIVSNVNLLTNVCNRPKTKIIVANQTVVPVSCSGDLQLTKCVGDNEFTIDVKDVLCVPNLTTNLLSPNVHRLFLKCKSETFKYFKQYKELVENQQSKKIKILRSDNGGEFCSTEMTNFLKQSGIVHQKTNSFTPEQNGLMYLKNRSPAAGLDGSKTPYEIWTGRKPELNHIRIFGSPTMVHIPKEKRRKWDKKAKKMYLVGYSENVKGYRLYDPISRDVIVGRDVVIMEKTDDSLSSSIGIEENRPLDTSAEKVPENDSDEENQHDETYVPDDVASDSEDSFEDTMTLSPEAEDIISQDSVESLPEKRVRRKPDFYQSANMCVEMLDEHISLSDAMNGSEKDQWQSAMQQELESFRDNDSWELVDRPSEDTPMEVNLKLQKDVKNKVVQKYPYQQLIGSLMFLSVVTRPDISFSQKGVPLTKENVMQLVNLVEVNPVLFNKATNASNNQLKEANEALEKVAAILGATCDGYTVPFGGDAQVEVTETVFDEVLVVDSAIVVPFDTDTKKN
ncbi:Retrovirus-related Pol polyprotein from transposon TNT 1-94 [Eumeta japonica]|uniref:Retrovirus-related Pol polyprotein from transposon TNT 1-94 n=1 Tax=Eumeta variegata TaxID=151549 RepID=A0A4C1VQE6_EUMVA|nr:Retrovirus-related Pol polyprotein from transposon TNT 1-94 [Eumeta japonica]